MGRADGVRNSHTVADTKAHGFKTVLQAGLTSVAIGLAVALSWSGGEPECFEMIDYFIKYKQNKKLKKIEKSN
ncbi:MAG: hypothetical protein HFG64_13210 [Lachnospiraceae bacterium]|nr:hypothetical protein [Lachnospiraceae bacterium]